VHTPTPRHRLESSTSVKRSFIFPHESHSKQPLGTQPTGAGEGKEEEEEKAEGQMVKRERESLGL